MITQLTEAVSFWPK